MGYSKEIYRQAQEELDRRRDTAQRTAQARREQLREDVPRFGEIEQEMSSMGIKAVRTAIESSDPQEVQRIMNRLRDRSLALQKERADLLKKAGLPADYLEIHYTCPKCQDTGYMINQRCSCMEQLLRQMAYASVSDSGGMGDCRFENFYLSYYPDISSGNMENPRRIMRRILEDCKQYAASFAPKSEGLLFQGNTGLGKTHLSLAIAYEVIEKGYSVYYVSCQRLLDKLQDQQFRRETASSTDYRQMALDCDLFILDDLGSEFSTAFSVAALQNLVNSRMSENRPTIVSTNLDSQQLRERYGERMLSRLLCACKAMPFCGDDIRMLKRLEQRR